MTASFETILMIGATSGIGEAFTKRFHALGKKVIATGRRQDRLDALKKELPGLETRQVSLFKKSSDRPKLTPHPARHLRPRQSPSQGLRNHEVLS